jgi:hypothetical protein
MAQAQVRAKGSFSESGTRRAPAWLPTVGGLLALTPFVTCAPEFRKLFWFGDEWDQLEELQRAGFWRYLTSTFAENFVPLFKALWVVTIAVGGGSYFAVLGAVWLTHAVNVMLLGMILRQVGFGFVGIATALVLAGFAASNIETLAWTIQWSAVLAQTFYLFGILTFLHLADGRDHRTSSFWMLAAASLASSLSFSRGVLSGCAIAFTCAVPCGIRSVVPRVRAVAALMAAIPAVSVAVVIAFNAHGNHERILQGPALQMAARLGAHFLCLNPFQRIWNLESRESLLVVLGATKISLYVIAFARVRARARWLVWLSLVLEISNAALVSVGRFHTGIDAAVGSRYQYVPLFCLAVPVGVVVDWFGATLSSLSPLTRWFAPVAPVLLAWSIARPWREQMHAWSGWRGMDVRALLDARRDSTLMPFVATVSTAEAHRLQERFHLH